MGLALLTMSWRIYERQHIEDLVCEEMDRKVMRLDNRLKRETVTDCHR